MKPLKPQWTKWELVLCLGFILLTAKLSSVLLVVGLIEFFLLLGGLGRIWPFHWKLRLGCVALAVLIAWIGHRTVRSEMFTFSVLQTVFLLTSPGVAEPRPVLRLSSLLFIVPLVVSGVDPKLGIPLVVLGILIVLSRMISLYSDMEPRRAFLWFVKRSLRRETIFVLAMVIGLAIIGLQRIRDGSGLTGGVSGLSGDVSPGTVQRLALSDAIAMKIEFDEVPTFNPSQVYIRSSTSELVRGFAWSSLSSRIRNSSPIGERESIRFTATLSSRYNVYLPMIDVGRRVEQSGKVSTGRSNGAFFPLSGFRGWAKYRGESVLKNTLPFDLEDRDQLLQIPEDLPIAVKSLATELGRGSAGQTFVSRWTNYLMEREFAYTLVPGDGSSNLSDFLFDSKAGYCEHYASATAILARAAGIPARVVTGFMGGSWTLESRTLIVRDLDAHAWAEIWDESTMKWLRYDATEFVAPTRRHVGSETWLRSIGAALPFKWNSEQSLLYGALSLQIQELFDWMRSDATDNVIQLAVTYSEEIALFGFVGILASYLWVRRKKVKRERRTEESRAIRALEKALAKKNFSRESGETVMHWLGRVRNAEPSMSGPIDAFTGPYAEYVYGSKSSPGNLRLMRSTLKVILKKVEKL